MKRYIKNIHNHLSSVAALALLTGIWGCSLNEEPPFLADDDVYKSESNQFSAMNGIYSNMINFNGFRADYHNLNNIHSGMFYTRNNAELNTVGSLNADPSSTGTKKFIEAVWRNHYISINRANDLIFHLEEKKELLSDNSLSILGQGYFLRAFHYFNLVKFFGGVPLRIAPTVQETIDVPRSTKSEVYDVIIKDIKTAQQLMLPEELGLGYPRRFAADMLMAKVYMVIASAADSNDEELAIPGYTDAGVNYWDSAYAEAIKVYGQYSLNSDFNEIFDVFTSNNTSESIFEIQFNEESGANSMLTLFTPRNYTKGINNWGKIMVNPEVYDRIVARYGPEDPRFNSTFLTSYVSYFRNNATGETGNGSAATYPEVNRGNKNNGFPYVYKYCHKNQEVENTFTNRNYLVFRYADLLLMLAEIQNERSRTAEALLYVNEVLTRARNSGDTPSDVPANWTSTDQEAFRRDIMLERHIELLAEGQDWIDARRRGYDFFEQNYVIPHNTFEFFNPAIDVEYTSGRKAMLLPIPLSEITTNLEVNNEDQNPYYK